MESEGKIKILETSIENLRFLSNIPDFNMYLVNRLDSITTKLYDLEKMLKDLNKPKIELPENAK